MGSLGLGSSLDWASYPILTFPEIPEIAYDAHHRSVM
jgi:hypothetical protein